MARQGGMIEPAILTYELGPCITVVVQKGRIDLQLTEDGTVVHGTRIDPELAPLFRMIANRLDEIAGKRERRP